MSLALVTVPPTSTMDVLTSAVAEYNLTLPGFDETAEYLKGDEVYDAESWKMYAPLKSFLRIPLWSAAKVKGWRLSTTAVSNAELVAKLNPMAPQQSDMGSTRFINTPRGTPGVFLISNARLCYAIKPDLPQIFDSKTSGTEEFLLGTDLPDSTCFKLTVELHPFLHRGDILNFFLLYKELLVSMTESPQTFHPTAKTVRDFMMLLAPPIDYNMETGSFELTLKLRAPWFLAAIDRVTIKRGTSSTSGKKYAVADKVFWKGMGIPDLLPPKYAVFFRTIKKASATNEVAVVMPHSESDFATPAHVNIGDTLTVQLNKPCIHQGSQGYVFKLACSGLSFTNDATTLTRSTTLLEDDIATAEDLASFAAQQPTFDVGSKRIRDETPHEEAVRKGISTQPEDDLPLPAEQEEDICDTVLSQSEFLCLVQSYFLFNVFSLCSAEEAFLGRITRMQRKIEKALTRNEDNVTYQNAVKDLINATKILYDYAYKYYGNWDDLQTLRCNDEIQEVMSRFNDMQRFVTTGKKKLQF